MAAFKVNLKINQGATFRKSFVWKSGASADAATPVDLTGWTARMQIREEKESPTVLHELTTENGGIALGGAAGSIDLFISATATAAFPWESGVYDIELVKPNGDVIRRAEGAVSVSAEVTRA